MRKLQKAASNIETSYGSRKKRESNKLERQQNFRSLKKYNRKAKQKL